MNIYILNIKIIDLSFIISFLSIIFLLIFNNGISFTSWDSVVSWNRWATEIYDRNIINSSQFYPKFWPIIWSYIYHLQNTTTYEYTCKLINIVPVIIFFLSISIYSKIISPFRGLLVLTLSFICYKYLYKDTLIGYMDLPVSFLTASYFLLILSLNKLKNINFTTILLLASLISAISSVTKQPGILILVINIICIFYFYFKKMISFKLTSNLLIICSLPLLIYIFFHFETSNIKFYELIFSNFTNYNIISSKTNLLSSDQFFLINGIRFFYNSNLFIVLLILIGSNLLYLLNIRSSNFINFLLFFTILIGYSLYSYCCTYSIRNSYLIIFISIILFSENLPTKIKLIDYANSFLKKKFITIKIPLNLICLLLIIILSLFDYLLSNISFFEKRHIYEKSSLGNIYSAKTLNKILNESDNCFIVHAPQQMIKYNFLLKDKFDRIFRTSATYASELLKTSYIDNKCDTYWIFYDQLILDDKFIDLINNNLILDYGNNVYKVDKKVLTHLND